MTHRKDAMAEAYPDDGQDYEECRASFEGWFNDLKGKGYVSEQFRNDFWFGYRQGWINRGSRSA